MADLVQTPANVKLIDKGTGGVDVVTYGETVVEGDWLRYNGTTRKWVKASNATSYESLVMALTAGLNGESGVVAKPGATVNVGAAPSIGVPYYLSANAGKMAPNADIVADPDAYVILLGHGDADNNFIINVASTGVQIP